MNYVLLATIAVVAAGCAAAYRLFARRQEPNADAPPAPRPRVGGRFSAVQIRTRSGACKAAQLLQGQRFLAKDAPTLPLRECKAPRCSCTFSKLPDRRSDGRRLEHGGLSASLFIAMNRRKKRDRRRAAEASMHG